MVSNKAVMLTNLDYAVSFPLGIMSKGAHIDTGEMGLIR
jgi:hypothetical protein